MSEDPAVHADAEARALAQTEFVHPVAIEAGAGTGKTAVLVARVVAWSLGPGWARAQEEAADATPPEIDAIARRVLRRIVAITFTEAAAAEMASRVAQALRDLRLGSLAPGLREDALPPAGPERAARAAALVGNLDALSVRTIHAFCRRILAAHPLEIGLHPTFQVDADGQAQRAAVRESLEAFLPRAFGARPDPDALRLSDAGVGPQDLEDATIALLESGVDAAALDRDPFSGEAEARLCGDFAAAAAALWEAGAARLHGVKGARTVETVAALEATQATELPDLDALRGFADEVWEKKNLDRVRKWARGDFSKGEEEAVGEVASELASAAVRFDVLARHVARLDPDGYGAARRVLRVLVGDAQERLRRAGIETFGGLLRHARDLLEARPRVAARVREGIDQLLVDEFQDTDAVQCALLRVLALAPDAEQRPGLFLVGDPKQSIYGWRAADLRAYEGFVRDALDAGGLRASLCVNFRSVPGILAEVERLVAPVMHESAGLQPRFERLYPCEARTAAAHPTRPAAEHWVTWIRNDAGEVEPSPPARLAARAEASAVAEDILAHNAQGVPFGSFAILMRALSDAETYLSALRDRGVPFVVERDPSYYERREIIDAIALVSCVLDPLDQVALVTTLRSVLVGVPDAALLPLWRQGVQGLFGELRAPDPGLHARIEARVRAAAAETPTDVPGIRRLSAWPEALARFADRVATIRAAAHQETPDRFVEQLREAFPLEACEAARTLGSFRVTNLDRFFRDLVEALDASGGDVASVLSHLKQSVSARREAEEGRPRHPGDDAVHVMTIHKAKGLDFDHVYLVQTHKRSVGSRGMETRGELHDGVLEAELLGLPSPRRHELVSDTAALESAERVRLLYVATTRARDRLVVMGTWPAAPTPPERARSMADLVAHRAPDGPPATPLARGEADADGVRWACLPEPSAARARRRSAEPGVALETIQAEQQHLDRERANARQWAQRSFAGAASDRETQGDLPAAARASGSAQEQRARRIAMQAGTLVHRLLEHGAADPDARAEAIEQWLPVVAPRDADEVRSRARAVLDAFDRGPLPERLAALAPYTVARELPVLLPSDTSDAEAPIAYTSGAIDWVYRDPDSGEWVVADFKTDDVSAGPEAEARAGAYRPQGAVYVAALQSALGLEVPPRFECWFLAAGQIVSIPVPAAG